MLKDLVLGRVGRVYNDPAALFQKADIDPIVDYGSLEVVFVIKETNEK